MNKDPVKWKLLSVKRVLHIYSMSSTKCKFFFLQMQHGNKYQQVQKDNNSLTVKMYFLVSCVVQKTHLILADFFLDQLLCSYWGTGKAFKMCTRFPLNL